MKQKTLKRLVKCNAFKNKIRVKDDTYLLKMYYIINSKKTYFHKVINIKNGNFEDITKNFNNSFFEYGFYKINEIEHAFKDADEKTLLRYLKQQLNN